MAAALSRTTNLGKEWSLMPNARATICVLVLFAAASVVLRARSAGAQEGPPSLVPWPRAVKRASGALALTAECRIVAAGSGLEALAKVLRDEIYLLSAVRLGVAEGPPRAGDIVLDLAPELKGEQYTLTVDDRAIVRGGNYRAVAWGTVTLLQALDAADGEVRVPRMTVDDKPVARYRGLLIDVARKWHPVETLRPLIEMCRLYKINYMQLHLNDQQSVTFPSKAFPELQSSYKGQRRTYTLEELTGLVRYADERGVTLVPELEGPGHHAGALRKLWGREGTSCLDMGSERTYEGLDTLIGEICEVFASSPYVHIGADECSLGGVGKSEEERAFMARHGLTGPRGLYNYYIARVNQIVKRHGKQTICWEGFHGDGGGGVKIPTDIVVMPFESAYNPADKLVRRGYTVINTAWKPLYVVNARKWPAQYIYESWNLWLWEHHRNKRCHIQLERTDPVLGAQMCAWEQRADIELPSTRERIHAMAERIWNPDAGRAYADFAQRARATDALLDRVLGIIDVRTRGLSGKERGGFYYFWHPVTVEMSCPPIGTIHYTIDGTEPTTASPSYKKPFTLTKDDTHLEKLFFNHRTKRYQARGDVVRVKARIFDAAGKPLGEVTTVQRYWHKNPDELKREEEEAQATQKPKTR